MNSETFVEVRLFKVFLYGMLGASLYLCSCATYPNFDLPASVPVLDSSPFIAFYDDAAFESLVSEAAITPQKAYENILSLESISGIRDLPVKIVWNSPKCILAGYYIFPEKEKIRMPLRGYAVHMKTGVVSVIQSEIILR